MIQFSARRLFFYVAIIIFCTACNKFDEVEVADRDAEFALPLFNASLSFQDLLENFDTTTFISVSPDNDIFVNYKGDVTTRTSLDIFETFRQFDNIPIPILDSVFALPISIPNGVDIDFGILKNGFISWGWQSTFQEDIRLRISVPNLKDPDGNLFEYIEDRTYSGNDFLGLVNDFNLSGYTLAPEQDSIYIRYELFRKDAGFNDKLDNFFIIIREFETSYLQGYLGQDAYPIDRDTIEIDLFQNWTRGDIYFADPKITLTAFNSFGFPIRSKANLVNVLTVDGNALPLRSTFIDNGINIDYPELNEVGQTIPTIFDFDKTNSNIDSILGAGPIAVDYDLDGLANPDGDTTIRGFLTDTSFIRTQVEVQLPMFGSSQGFIARDTIQADLSEFADVTAAELKVISENEMPLQTDVQVLFADANYTLIDSAFVAEETLVSAAPTDASGNVTAVEKKITFVDLPAERFEAIRQAKFIIIRVAFSTYNDGQVSVRVKADQEIKVRAGIKISVD